MKHFFIITAGLLLASTTSLSFAEESTKAPGAGSNKAVVEVSKEEGIKLSEKAKATIGIKTMRLLANFLIPKSALIHERGEFGVYVKHGDWFKYIEVEADNPSSSNVKIESKKIEVGAEIVTSDVSLLRLAELNVWNTGGDND